MMNEKAYQEKYFDGQEGGTPFSMVDGIPIVIGDETVYYGEVVDEDGGQPLLTDGWSFPDWARNVFNEYDWRKCSQCGKISWFHNKKGGSTCPKCQHFSPYMKHQ